VGNGLKIPIVGKKTNLHYINVRRHDADEDNIMRYWLKLIGSAKRPIAEWQKDYVGFRKANKPSIRAGDRLFLYAPGGSRRIFALAEALGDPELDSSYNPNEEGSCRWRLRVDYEINLPVDSGILIDEIVSHRKLTMSIRQASHIRLHPEEIESAHRALDERRAKQ